MAHIAVITHACDNFLTENYLLRSFVGVWAEQGHRVTLCRGAGRWPDADLAILHVDLSVVPTAYAQAQQRYAKVINGAALDIRKRKVSSQLLKRTDAWRGAVIVKTDLNCNGLNEMRVRRALEAAGAPVDETLISTTSMSGDYPIFASMDDVPPRVWNDPGLVVERYFPQRDEDGFWMAAWVFFGDRERCTYYRGSRPIVRSGNILERRPIPVPETLRQERARLGFDYGKFDFVMHEGQAILIDANRTPGSPPDTAEFRASNRHLAEGIDQWLEP